MKKLLIITGPQGSGNHLFSRLFSLHAEVGGWKELLGQYWIPSDEETFAEFWVNPQKLEHTDFSGHDFWVANVSVPFVFDGVKQVPKIKEFILRAQQLNVEVTVAVIVRDQNINKLQQQRVRKEVTLPIAIDYYLNTLQDVCTLHFLDHEAFFLYKQHYLKYVSNLLKFPIDYNNPDILRFITDDANGKYVNYVEEHWLDKQVWNGIKSKQERGIEQNEHK
jgi:hypothetical protein